jgi:DNA-binding transcriptional MerR regulator
MMIGELSARSGLTQSRIRFYEASGLLVGTKRRTNGYREFNVRTLEILELIHSAQQAGFTLQEIRLLLPKDSDMKEWDRDTILKTLQCKIGDFEAQERQMKKTKARLLAIIDAVGKKPSNIDCLENWKRVIEILREQA